MLVEIPEPEVIFSVIVAFLLGLFALYLYFKLKPYVNLKKKDVDPAYFERLEYYERQLIDMKIRLDALDIDELSNQNQVIEEQVEQKEKPKQEKQTTQKVEPVEIKNESRMPNLPYDDIVSHILGLITTKPMTSRDIQITIDRTREHTSRLMKKLYKDGFVERHTNTKPYTYSITEKGKLRISQKMAPPPTV